MTEVLIVFMLAMAPLGSVGSVQGDDPTATALRQCLDDDAHASTGGQTACEAVASDEYDRRMNTAYDVLMRMLPAEAAQHLRQAQRAWLAFRSAEADARSALYSTRRGTMYVPMQADDGTNIIRDRALLLEGYVRVLQIEG